MLNFDISKVVRIRIKDFDDFLSPFTPARRIFDSFFGVLILMKQSLVFDTSKLIALIDFPPFLMAIFFIGKKFSIQFVFVT